MKIKVGVAGACGRMGLGIVKALNREPDMELVLAIDPQNVGRDIGELAGIGVCGVIVTGPGDMEKDLSGSEAGVLIDFTNWDVVIQNALSAAMNDVQMVIGTTGLKKEAVGELEKIFKENGVSAVMAPNMAIGVNIFFKLVEEAAKKLGDDFDVEVVEVHHRHKKDAPSGTALRAAEGIAKALGRNPDRTGGEIGIHSIRAGDVFGDHTVIFAGEAERIEITHRAHSREAFIAGVIKAVRFIQKPPEKGIIYDMWDVLGIK